jgi:hypothetical protein
MRLPELEAGERACLQAPLTATMPQALAGRLQQHLIASLGVPASVSETGCGDAQNLHAGAEPAITIAPELAAAWLALRLGGRTGARCLPIKDEQLAQPFRAMVRRALAESVINSGTGAWPQLIRLNVALDGQQGAVEIFWNSAHAMAWSRRTVREKA